MAFVDEVAEDIKEATWLLQGMERGPKLVAVVKELAEAEALLSQRIHHIKIADRSEHGWATVREYETETDKLALDSDDKNGFRRHKRRLLGRS